MGDSIVEERKAVEAGYWPIYRYNPLLAARHLSPFIADSVAAENARPVDGLPATGSPTPAENADYKSAGEGSWIKVNTEATPLTVDYPGSPDIATKPETETVTDDSVSLFPPERLFDFLDGEDRYADIRLVAPQAADRLRSILSARTNLLHRILMGLTRVI